jgi:hypothetical protein
VFASSPIFGPLFDSEATTIAGFFAALAEPPPWRNLQAIPIRAQLPELWSDLALPRFIDPARLADAFLWIGQHGQATALHYDAMDNLNAVVRGGKRFTLFSPEDTGLLYHCPLDAPRPGAYYSLVDPRAPDLQRYPRFADAAPVEVALAAGEMLFLPAFWWHQVESVGESFAVSFWSRLCEPALERRLSAAMGALDAVAKELPAAWRRHLLRLCRDLVLADPPDD